MFDELMNSQFIQMQLKQIHNDILVLHLCEVMKEMHNVGSISDEEYRKMLHTQYEIINSQIIGQEKK